jgi:hypothetical protein
LFSYLSSYFSLLHSFMLQTIASIFLYFYLFLSYFLPFSPCRFRFVILNIEVYHIWYSISLTVDIMSCSNRGNKESIIRISRELHLKGIESMFEKMSTQIDRRFGMSNTYERKSY